jgi:hypothetical protein
MSLRRRERRLEGERARGRRVSRRGGRRGRRGRARRRRGRRRARFGRRRAMSDVEDCSMPTVAKFIKQNDSRGGLGNEEEGEGEGG